MGQISYLIPITFIFTGISIIKSKEFFLIFENTFYIIIYCLFGSLFFTYFYEDSFTLYINGNGGFVGKYLNQIFVNNIINLNQDFIYYLLFVITILLFLISINLNLKTLKSFSERIFSTRNKTNYQNKDEIISEYIPQEEIKNLIQEDLPFIKADKLQQSKVQSFKLPSIDLLKISKREKRNSDNENVDPNFLEKILLDFGVNGSIKKVSQGPVVTLNEFEPAAGIKVSKIINLSDDIARNTSSESARIATIPGSNTIGIEIPNSSREDVYLSEILNNQNFKKKTLNCQLH